MKHVFNETVTEQWVRD